jgi:hypothetical protein
MNALHSFAFLRPGRNLAACLLAAAVAGCSGPQIHSTSQHQAVSLQKGELLKGGVAFITPSSITGQEEDKQALALAAGAVMTEQLPGMRFVPLAETLSLVNRNGLAGDYKKMFDEYRDTGLFKRETLQKLGEATGARYLVQLKLSSFTQGSKERFGAIGFRMLETHTSTMRLFMQIWDSKDGSVAWEGAEELSYAVETFSERNPTLQHMAEEATRRIIANLP